MNDHAAVPSPELNLQERGIAISAAPSLRDDGTKSIVLRGVFRGSLEEADVAPAKLLQTIAVTLIFGPEHLPTSFPAGRQRILLEDDLKRVGNDVIGSFEIDVFEEAELAPLQGTYFLSAAMGPCLSNVCEVHFPD